MRRGRVVSARTPFGKLERRRGSCLKASVVLPDNPLGVCSILPYFDLTCVVSSCYIHFTTSSLQVCKHRLPFAVCLALASETNSTALSSSLRDQAFYLPDPEQTPANTDIHIQQFAFDCDTPDKTPRCLHQLPEVPHLGPASSNRSLRMLR